MSTDRRGEARAPTEGPSAGLLSGIRRAARQPRVAMALKAAVAAAVAWTVVQPIGGVVDNYPYYAPFGAVVAVSTTVVSSARESLQSVLAILLGGGAAIALDIWLGKGAVTVAAVVAVGTVLGGWRRLGAMGGWVPFSGLFVLILGAAHPEQYAAAYAGLTALGATIGVGVNFMFPPLPLDTAKEALDRLRDTLARQFDDLAESLLAEEPMGLSDAQERAQAVESASAETRATVQRATEAQRANWRARRWRERARRQYDAAMMLEQLPFLVEEVTAIVDHETADQDRVPWGAPLRPRIAHALQATVDLLRSIDGDGAGNVEVMALDEALDRLTEEVRQARNATGDDLFGVGSIITTLRRARASVQPRSAEPARS
jgi:uncharacterized membrane protein YgaE (UPF0421/DUF939 family)